MIRDLLGDFARACAKFCLWRHDRLSDRGDDWIAAAKRWQARARRWGG